jgi:hypothetical protein
MTSRALVWFAVALILMVAVGLPLFLYSSGRFVTGTIDYVTASLVNVSGMSPMLARGLVILATIPFFWAVAKYTRTLVGFRRLRPSLDLYLNRYGIVIVSYVAAFFLAMYFSSRSAYFGLTTGETLKWCSETLEGIRVFDSPGVDPVYGVRLTPCSADQIASRRAVEVGLVAPTPIQVADPRGFGFFEGTSRRARVWYTRTPDGQYELFDRPGVHPTTGRALQPIDEAAVAEILRLHEDKLIRDRRLADEQVERDLKAQAAAQEAAVRAEHEAMLNRYLSRARAARSSTAVLVTRNGHIDHSFTQAIASVVSASTGLFTPAFVQDGLFDRVLEGDSAPLRDLELGSRAMTIVLATVSSATSSDAVAGENVVKARATIALRLYRTTQAFPSRLLTAIGEGVGFSSAAAEERASKAALQEAIRQLSQAM